MDKRFEDFAVNITDLYRFLKMIKDEEMKSLGLGSNHLYTLYFLNLHPEGLSISELVKCSHQDKAAISRACSELCTKEYLIKPDYETRNYRGKYKLSKQGLVLVKEIEYRIAEALLQCSEGISLVEREVFYKVIHTLSANLQTYMENIKERNNHE